MNYELLSRQLILAARGKRSSAALSRKMGFRSNPIHSWEMGRRAPTAAVFLRLLAVTGKDVPDIVEGFLGTRPQWFKHSPPATREGVAALLNDLRGRRTVVDIARSLSVSRFQVQRWLAGDTEPKLSEFLRVLEAVSSRMLDFVARVVPIKSVPTVADDWLALQAARRSAYDLPESHAVLRVLELSSYQQLRRHQRGFVAKFLGISLAEEERCIELLLQARQVEWCKGRLQVTQVRTVDINADPKAAHGLKVWAAQRGASGLATGADGVFSYNLFCVSQRDFTRIQDLHRAYFREMRAIVASSQPAEKVILANLQLVDLDTR